MDERKDSLWPAILMLVGVGLAIVGAATASSLDPWDLDRIERVHRIAEGPIAAWTSGSILLALGVASAAAGMASVSVTGALHRIGAQLWVLAGAIGVAGFVFSSLGGTEAAEIFIRTGVVPDGFLVVDRIQEGLIVLFGGLASAGSLSMGVGILKEKRYSRPVSLGLIGGGAMGLAMLPLNVPIIAMTGPVILGFGLLFRRGESGELSDR